MQNFILLSFRFFFAITFIELHNLTNNFCLQFFGLKKEKNNFVDLSNNLSHMINEAIDFSVRFDVTLCNSLDLWICRKLLHSKNYTKYIGCYERLTRKGGNIEIKTLRIVQWNRNGNISGNILNFATMNSHKVRYSSYPVFFAKVFFLVSCDLSVSYFRY